jgi:hypothetical protein
MSGHKKTTVTISEAEYRRLHESQIAKRFSEEHRDDIIKALRSETQKALQEHLKEMNLRQMDFQMLIGEFSSELGEYEQQTNQSIDFQREKIDSQIKNLSNDLMTDIRETLDENLTFFDQIFQSEKQRQEGLENEITERLFNLELGQQEKNKIAEECLTAVSEMSKFIGERYLFHFDLTAPIEIANRKISQVYENLRAGLIETTITQCQQLFSDLSELRILLEKNEMQWEWLIQSVKEKAGLLVQFVRDNAQVQAIDLEGKELPYALEVNYWSAGEFNNLADYVEQLNQQITTPGAYIEIPVLEDLLQNTFPQLEKVLDTLIFDVRIKAIQSQMRMNIADLVIQAFFDQGYNLQSASYDEKDPRRSFQARLNHISGSEVVIQVDPGEGDELRNDLHLFSLDHERLTTHELHQRSKEIRKSLQSHGLQIGATSTQPMETASAQVSRKTRRTNEYIEMKHEQAN